MEEEIVELFIPLYEYLISIPTDEAAKFIKEAFPQDKFKLD